jgi:hypothetical protein
MNITWFDALYLYPMRNQVPDNDPEHCGQNDPDPLQKLQGCSADPPKKGGDTRRQAETSE